MLSIMSIKFCACYVCKPGTGDRGLFSFVPFLSLIEGLDEWFNYGTPKSSSTMVCITKGCHLLDLGNFDSFKRQLDYLIICLNLEVFHKMIK